MQTPSELANAVDAHVGWHDRSDRVRLEIQGPDRLKFLHNLTTNEIKRREVGQGCETFVTSLQGKTLGFVTLLFLDESILLRTDPGGLAHILPHFQKYGALDEVSWEEISERTFEHHLAGPRAGELLQELGAKVPLEGELNHGTSLLEGVEVRIVREAPLGVPGFTLLGAWTDAETARAAAFRAGDALGLVELDREAFEALRIEAGTPVFGPDINEKNLPQEVGRDARAISFVKGCYLGQETVARIDALGHVNREFRRLSLQANAPPPPGTPLFAGEKEVGTITSSAVSLRSGKPIALGYVRTLHAKPGTELTIRGPAGAGTVFVSEVSPSPPA